MISIFFSKLLNQWRIFRDKLLISERFQRLAVAFPLTRPIAQRRMRALFDLCAGFVYSQILLACVRLGLFDILAKGPQSVAAIAAQVALPEVSTERLLRAAVSLQLAERRSADNYGLGILGAALQGNPGVVAMINHHALLYDDLRDPVALLRDRPASDRSLCHKLPGYNTPTGSELNRYWAYAKAEQPAASEPEQIAAYTTLMSASQPLISSEILAAYPLHTHQCLLDVGGGDGAFLRAVAKQIPNLQLKLFDLPAVTEQAAASFARENLQSRVQIVAGDMLSDPLPKGADVVSLIRVIHDHDDAAALTLLRAVREALPSDGVVLLAEPMAGTSGAEPIGDAYFGFYLLAMGSGRPRTAAELHAMLEATGYSQIRFKKTRTPILLSLLTARAS